MTDTAYSKALQKEVDPEQYVALLSLDDSTVHAFAREDVVCPICETGGGSYVRSICKRLLIAKRPISGLREMTISAHITHLVIFMAIGFLMRSVNILYRSLRNALKSLM